MSRLMAEEARRYFEDDAARAEARDEKRFCARRLQDWIARTLDRTEARSPQAA